MQIVSYPAHSRPPGEKQARTQGTTTQHASVTYDNKKPFEKAYIKGRKQV